MTPERWQKLKEVCNLALEREPAERLLFVSNACGEDQELRREAESMIARATLGGGVLDGPIWKDFAEDSADEPSIPIPETIGSYRILRVIGEGGMGVVYEAQQDQPRRQVALKVIRPGLASPQMLRRFDRESQALARLHHIGIAQIYEAGAAETTHGSQPYFAMEFIQGTPLRQYADSHDLGNRARLQLMSKICEAVEHAHQKGIIHRDLKPGNILVDETGQPKILDFGVARLTDSDAQMTKQTDIGQLVGTLAYMSPEQVLGDPAQLDSRSDVYALGVILYELLVQRLPYKISDHLFDAVRTIRDEDPTRLSTINRTFRGDVETIVAKALEKDKTRRYASAAAMRGDIQNYLADEPITARPASTAYQLQKFAQRHKALVGATAIVFVVLIAGVIVSTREALKARRAEQVSAAVNDFLQHDLLAQAGASAQASPDTKPDPDIKVRTALDRAAAKIGDRFASQPLVEASIRETIGATYMDLGLFEQGEQQLERVVELRRRFLGEDNSDTLLAMRALAGAYIEQTKFADAESLLKIILPLRRRISGDDNPLTAKVMEDLATAYTNQGKYAEAEPLYLKVVDINRRLLGADSPITLDTMSSLGILYRKESKYQNAEDMYKQVLDARRRILGENHPDTLLAMNLLGMNYVYEGRFPEAEELLTKTLDERRRILGPDHPNTLLTMNNLSLAYNSQGKFAQAEALLRQTLATRMRISGPDNSDTVLAALNLCDILDNENKYKEEGTLVSSSLETSQRVFGKDHPYTLQLTTMQARVRERANNYADAESLYTTALEGRSRILGPDHITTLFTAISLARIRLERREYKSADELFRATLASYVKSHPAIWQRYACETLLGASLASQGKYDEAEPFLLSGYQGMDQQKEKMAVSSRHFLDDARETLVKLYKAQRKPDKAAEWSAKITTKKS